MTARKIDPDVSVRLATLADVATLAHHRAEMFRDMGQLTEHNEREVTRASEAFFRDVVATGEYITWLAVVPGVPERVIAGAGLWLRPMLPRPVPAGVITGFEALVANVYTEPDWRRRGLAAMLMRHVLDYATQHRIERVLLHASDHGRPLYEQLGFIATNEMKLAHQS